MTKVSILKTYFLGYERLYLLELTKTNNRFWAYGIDYNNYIESESDNKKSGIKEATFSII